MGGVSPLPAAMRRASLPGAVQTTTAEPGMTVDRLEGTNSTIGAVGETVMSTVWPLTNSTVSKRPRPVLVLVFIITAATADTNPWVMLVAIVPDESMPEG